MKNCTALLALFLIALCVSPVASWSIKHAFNDIKKEVSHAGKKAKYEAKHAAKKVEKEAKTAEQWIEHEASEINDKVVKKLVKEFERFGHLIEEKFRKRTEEGVQRHVEKATHKLSGVRNATLPLKPLPKEDVEMTLYESLWEAILDDPELNFLKGHSQESGLFNVDPE